MAFTTQEKFEELPEPVVYFSNRRRHIHTLRPTRKVIVDGEPVVIPGIRVRFINGRAEVRDRQTFEAMEKALKNPKWARIMHRAPTREEQERARKVAQEIEKAKREIIAKKGPPQPISPTFKEHVKKTVSERKKIENGATTSIQHAHNTSGGV